MWSLQRFRHEMQKFDSLLRIRRSQDRRWWLIERKCGRESKCLIRPRDFHRHDQYVCAKDGYIHVTKIPWDRLDHQVFLDLRAMDMWAYRGAGWYADHLEAQERRAEELEEQRDQGAMVEAGCEAYDRIRFLEGRQASGFYSRVGGWEPEKVSP